MPSSGGGNSTGDIANNLEAKSDELLKACLRKLGMKLEQVGDDVLQLSVIHISSIVPPNAQKLKDSWKDLITQRTGVEYFVDASDTFRLEEVSAEKPSATNDKSKEGMPAADRSIEESDLHILVHVEDYPTHEETPFFNHMEFYSSVQSFRSTSSQHINSFGSYLMYGEVITSTNTILEK
jgi:biotin---protein ligase